MIHYLPFLTKSFRAYLGGLYDVIKTITVFVKITKNRIILGTCEMEPLALMRFADCSVSFVYKRGRITLAVASLSTGAQLSSCNLLHFFPTNRIAVRPGHYVYIQRRIRAACSLSAIPCALAFR